MPNHMGRPSAHPKRLLLAVSDEFLAKLDAFDLTESNINWWVAEILPKGARNGKAPKRISRKDAERAVIQQNDEGPRPVAAAEDALKTAEGPMQFIGLGYVGGSADNAEIERRLAYAVSELGGVLVKNDSYGIARANGGADIQAAGASLSTVRTLGRAVDPGIP